jgi:glutamate racemase
MQEVEQHAIGIFDSGVGGLTVLKALRQELPGRDFLYVGDTARVPYGRKPRAMVEQFAWEITGFLMDQGADAVVIACNTASAASLPRLAEQMPIPIWGVVDPGVSAACKLTRTGSVGVIGTRGTIDSGAYQDRLRARGLDVWAQACPLFVHLVEEGLAESEEAELLAHHYLDERPPIDALILGCTHYPLLEKVIRRVLGWPPWFAKLWAPRRSRPATVPAPSRTTSPATPLLTATPPSASAASTVTLSKSTHSPPPPRFTARSETSTGRLSSSGNAGRRRAP